MSLARDQAPEFSRFYCFETSDKSGFLLQKKNGDSNSRFFILYLFFILMIVFFQKPNNASLFNFWNIVKIRVVTNSLSYLISTFSGDYLEHSGSEYTYCVTRQLGLSALGPWTCTVQLTMSVSVIYLWTDTYGCVIPMNGYCPAQSRQGQNGCWFNKKADV